MRDKRMSGMLSVRRQGQQCKRFNDSVLVGRVCDKMRCGRVRGYRTESYPVTRLLVRGCRVEGNTCIDFCSYLLHVF